ncbi:MAG: hypothetical protein ACK2T0_11765 [Anaerolineales bacterium]
MSKRHTRGAVALVAILGMALLPACSVPTSAPATQANLVGPAASPVTTKGPPPVVSTVVIPLPASDTATSEATKAPAAVKVTAVSGNIFIRRGPDLAFNPVSVLMKGQTAAATGRDVLSRWVRIPLPGDPSKIGWVTIVTDYTQVKGDVESLPEISPTEWPELAFLRNCTHDLMVANPAGITIPPLDYFPDNEVQIDPGQYSIVDVDVDKYPEVLTAQIKEGSVIDIIYDGTGEKHKCPLR